MGFNCTLYNCCFFFYVVTVPVFLQYLMRAPSTFDVHPFYPVPIGTLNGDVPVINMSTFPQTTSQGVTHCRPCYEDKYHKKGMYQWDITLTISNKDLVKQTHDKPVSTLYPVIFLSNDLTTWFAVADGDDVAATPKNGSKGTIEPTHISAPLLVGQLKPFGCVTNESGSTDPSYWYFPSEQQGRMYKWRLVKHISMHGSVSLVACVMQGWEGVNAVLRTFSKTCLMDGGATMKCHKTPQQALSSCFAVGSACGQACGFFSPHTNHCMGGILDEAIFEGVTTRRVRIKTAAGGGAAESLVNCNKEPCKDGLHFSDMYVEADNPNEFFEAMETETDTKKHLFYTIIFALSDGEADADTRMEAPSTTTKRPKLFRPGGRFAPHHPPPPPMHRHPPPPRAPPAKAPPKAVEEEEEEEEEPTGTRHPPPPPPPLRRLAETKYFWELAHVPNLTIGLLKDQGSNTMRVSPLPGSCFTQPGFTYMVACMTAKPVYMSSDREEMDPPPFNDRCLAVGGICGASCGSGEEMSESVSQSCPLATGEFNRRLMEGSPYASAVIPKEFLVSPIEPRKSATNRSGFARFFFNMFIFFSVVSYVSTILSKFPGNFTDFYPMHTWDEIRTHGYVLEKFGCAVACGSSATETKMVVFRNWIGKIAARPHFDDTAFPTFKRWVDVFDDEGHREGARILWFAWTSFLDTNPPCEFLEAWSNNCRELTWDQSLERSPFDLVWHDSKSRKVLPVTPEQSEHFLQVQGEEVMGGGIELQLDSLAKLKDLFEVFKFVPDNLKMEPSLPKKDDVILTREVRMGLHEPPGKRDQGCFTIKHPDWKNAMNKKVRERSDVLQQSEAEYKKNVTVTDKSGKNLDAMNMSDIPEKQFPLHFREPMTRKDRKVFMIYVGRARPETDRKGIEKTRALDKYLWACLRPSAVRPYDRGDRSKSRNSQSRKDENAPLLHNSASQETLSASSTGSGGDVGETGLSFEECKKCVEGVVERQHKKFLDGLQARTIQKEYAEAYMKYRLIESDWEVARFCYGEIVGEDRDVDGDEVLILDNPSPSLLEVVSNVCHSGRRGMGLVALETVQETSCFCLTRSVSRVAFAANPGLEFFFTATDTDAEVSSEKFEQEFRKELQKLFTNTKQEMRGLRFQQKKKGSDLIVNVAGPGKLIEDIRDRALTSIKVLNYQGRIMDNHPTVIVKKDLLVPYAGVRGKGGGLNFSVDLLQYRDGFIGTGADSDPTPERLLFGIFDARHQPHPDFWRQCLPKFMNNKDIGYTYEANNDVIMVQAPQSFAALSADEDTLDVLNGMCFNIMNVIRNRCGGVTSCGTNAVWQVNARDFPRTQDDDVLKEFFDSRTKIEDTASTHLHFCKGKRSVYVHEKVATGIAKINSDYLGAVQRWAEGAVQLFWVQLFVDKTKQLVIFAWCVICFMLFHYFLLYGPWTKQLIGFNLFCDSQGIATLFTGYNHSFCDPVYQLFSSFLGHTIDRVMFKMAEGEYMRMIDIAITWLLICITLTIFIFFLSLRNSMPPIVRRFVMLENITYFWTSCAIFFWLSLTIFMVVGHHPPLMFNANHFMMFVLCIKVAEHTMLQTYKALGDCNELSIWRSQQSYTICAPLHIMSILQGSAAAWGICWKKIDKSFWTPSDHGAEVIRFVTIWVTFIWLLFIFCVAFTSTMYIRFELFHDLADKFEIGCQLGACFLMLLLAITVWEPLVSVWGFNRSIDDLSKDESKYLLRWWARLCIWWRSRAWIVRYMVDFGLPFLILSGVMTGFGLLTPSAYATTVQGFRV